MGQGAIGQSFTMLTAMQGARQVIAVDLLDYRLQWSKDFGATHTINPSKENLADAVREITGGGAGCHGGGGGLPGDARHRLPAGAPVWYGGHIWVQGGDIVPVDTRTWMDNQPTIIPTTGARSGDPITHIKNMVALKERGLVDPGRMVTHRLNFDVEDVNKAYQMYEQRLDNVLKVVMSVGA